MSRPTEVAEPVRRFVERQLESVEQLEIVLLLRREQSRFWDPRAVAMTLQIVERRTAENLEALASRGLLDVRIGTQVTYRYSPATPELARGMDRVAAAYSEHRVAVLALLMSRGRRSLRDFADAFRLDPDRDDG
jgi:hypothetical protein